MKFKMQTNIKPNRAKRTVPLLLSISIMGILLASVGGLALSPAFGATSYNNVQVFAQTTSLTQGIFTIAAYNSSGFLVSSSQTMYPAAAFELPSGTYLFTVSAMDQSNYYPYPAPMMGSGTSNAGAPTATDVVPSPYQYPKVEYGFQLQQVSGPSSLNIKTLPIENITLTKISVKVLFANGTAAADTSVSASVVGAWYWWYGPDANLKMYTQTGADGIAQLTVPSVPVEVTAWNWIPVQLPTNRTTIPVDVGGETVNVTVYWQPTYVGLGGSALIIPPQNSATITLHVQQPTYWYMSKDLATGSSSGASPGATSPTATSAPTSTSSPGTLSNTASGVPAFISSQFSSSSTGAPSIQTQIPSITTTTASPGTVTTATPDYTLPLTIAVVAALAIAVLSFALVIVRSRKKSPSEQPQ
jgi:hypothetical protein